MNAAPEQSISHFWVASNPFFEGSLILTPFPSEITPSTEDLNGATSTIEMFDPDGGLVNKLSVTRDGGYPMVLELDSLMEGCKLESGIRHGHLIVTSPPGIRAMARLHNRGGATIINPVVPLTQDHAVFSPVALGPHRSSLVAIINFGAQEASVRCRLMLANRSPDMTCNIPPFGARLICVEREFQDVLVSGFGKRRSEEGKELEEAIPEVRAYIRMGSRTEQSVGVQYIEGVERGDSGMVFSATSI